MRGRDFTISLYSMQISLHARARSHNMTVTSQSNVTRVPDEVGLMTKRETLTFRFAHV